MKLLLASADQNLRKSLKQTLTRHSFVVDLATHEEDAWGLLQTFQYDVVLLDVALPHFDGISLCRRLREVGNPILLLLLLEPTAPETCVRGLDSGADACLTKPVKEPELLAHLRALARRGLRRASPMLSWGPLRLDPTAQRVTCQGQALTLNRKEYQLLELFFNHPRQMFPRSEIGDRLWSLDNALPTDATIKSHIRSLRRKLEQAGVADLIQTHYGQGYRLNPAYDPGLKTAHDAASTPALRMDIITANIWQELMLANAQLTQEIDQRKQIESQLRRSEMMLRNAQRVAQIGCWLFDLHTRENYWTEELFLIHGLDPRGSAPTEAEILAMIHPEDRPIHEESIRLLALKRQPFEANLRIIRANDGEIRLINARGGPLFDDDGKVTKLTGTTFDITCQPEYSISRLSEVGFQN